MKDFLTAIGELDEDDVLEFERNFRFDDLTAAEIEEQLDMETLERVASSISAGEVDVVDAPTNSQSALASLQGWVSYIFQIMNRAHIVIR